MEEEVSFIDREGNKISIENISSHIGLANAIIENNEKLKDEFLKSGKKDPVDFLIYNKGYIKTTTQQYYRKCVCSSSKISDRQRTIIGYYYEEGYKIDDLDIINMQKNISR